MQPVSSIGLVVLLIFSHFYLEERLKTKEWLAAGLAFVGVLGLGISAEGGGGAGVGGAGLHHTSSGSQLFSTKHTHSNTTSIESLNLNTIQMTSQGGGMSSPSSSSDFHSSSHAAVALDSALCGLEAGACFGLSAAASRTGFIMAHKLSSPIWVIIGLGASVGLSSSGFVLQTKGLKSGNTVVVCTMASVSSMVSGVAAGLFALGERLPKSRLMLTIRFISWLFILMGTGSLAGGTKALKPILKGLSLDLPSLPPTGQGWMKHLPPRLVLVVRRMARSVGLRVIKGEEEEGGSDDDEEPLIKLAGEEV